MIDLADKSYLQKPLPHPHEDKLIAAQEYLLRRKISVLLPRKKCQLKYVPSEGGSRVLQEARLRALKAAA